MANSRPGTPDAAAGRLRPPPDVAVAGLPAGLSEIVADGAPTGLRYVPGTAPRRLVILLHGAGGTAENALRLLLPSADTHGLLLIAPRSLGATWDMLSGGYGPDVRRLQQALDQLPRTSAPMAVGGFSDGASYALSLGLINGDLFDAVLAFSPGFAAATERHGHPAFFVSHGRADRVLPVDRCSRRLVPMLRRDGYQVHYSEFDGGHVVPPAIVDEALAWLRPR